MRLLRFVAWLLLCLAVINIDAWDRSPWDAPQTEWFQHAIQWDAKWDLGKEQS